MPIIFIDGVRIYKFMIGYKFKIGQTFYEILGIEPFKHLEALGSLAASTTTTKDFTTYMKPLDNYIYFVEWMAIDGNCGFQFQFQKGIPHGTVRGNTEYLYFDDAKPSDPLYWPFLIIPPNYPTWALYNPTASANNSDAIFKGERWLVKKLGVNETPPEGQYTILTDYAAGGIGQG